MANQRAKGTKLAGAYIPAEKDAALDKLAKDLGYPNKAEYLRALFDAALKQAAIPPPTSKTRAKKKD